MDNPITVEDIRQALAGLEATLSRVPDFHILLPNEAMPDVVRAQLEWVKDHVYFSGNIEQDA